MLDKCIRNLGLSIKITHCLITEGIDTIGKIKGMSSSEILKIPNLGKKSLKEIEEKINDYTKKNTISSNLTIDINEFKNIILNKTYASISNYFDNGGGHKLLKGTLESLLNEMQPEIESKLFQNINEMRTIILEQSRILEGMQSINRYDGVINKINEKIPGFNNIIYEIYKTLSKNNEK